MTGQVAADGDPLVALEREGAVSTAAPQSRASVAVLAFVAGAFAVRPTPTNVTRWFYSL